MKFLALFCLFATAAASGKPVRPGSDKPYFGAISKNPKEYEVVSVKTQSVAGLLTTLDVIFQESTCDTNKNLKEITAENCPVKSNGQRSVWRVTDHHKPWLKQHIIGASKIEDLQPENEPTSTQSTNRGYTISDDTEPTNGIRNARDLKNVYEWH
ncbi:hypothetical protein CAEBREN_16201 [Caenorhabditis brenneri]|uniref:Uncharacterized protein n=1 Tax=Caenorhabditis brenneri TaxID=135651 RepID=G0NW12_CAEBE|nr:hypothetical protein CAEBREN_16201 [Caenorhabditis brenneri]